LDKYSLWGLHQQINSAATQMTEREGSAAEPFPFPHRLEKGDTAGYLLRERSDCQEGTVSESAFA